MARGEIGVLVRVGEQVVELGTLLGAGMRTGIAVELAVVEFVGEQQCTSLPAIGRRCGVRGRRAQEQGNQQEREVESDGVGQRAEREREQQRQRDQRQRGPGEGELAVMMVPELRPSVGFANFEHFGKLKMNHKYQLEARFFQNQVDVELVSGYSFSNFRFRYQLGFDYPLLKVDNSDKIIIKLKDEIMLNIGNQIVKNTFDQNRVYLGLNFVVKPKLAFEVGYLNWFQQQKSGGDYYNRDILRFSFFHTIS